MLAEFVQYCWLIPALPLFAFIIIILFGNRLKEGGALVAIIASGLSFVLALGVMFAVLDGTHDAIDGKTDGRYEYSIQWLWHNIDAGVLVDQLSAVMMLVVSFVSFLVVVYSYGYMHVEKRRPEKAVKLAPHTAQNLPRYYAEISLFIGSMLGLVIANNYLMMYIFWELVGLCSYLLIGFWYTKPEAAAAAKKAFLVTRVGDIFFLVGIAVLFNHFGTLNIFSIASQAPVVAAVDPRFITFTSLLLFGGAMGKSAQFPLHVWLPDAMEGPTTVSALIHAATMVNAGVYLVARAMAYMAYSPDAMLFIAFIGALTAFLAASMALVQNDIKRVLAYSTISQLGYMFLALGAGGYFWYMLIAHEHEPTAAGFTAGIFHLVNHAFFKALLFLCAGSVIHAVHTNNMFEMGGLHRKMRLTSITMLIGAMSLAGIPFFSGFFSKETVLGAVHEASEFNPVFSFLFLLALLTAFLTAFYMFRLWFLTFVGRPQTPEAEHAHEAPYVMTVPLLILAVFAIFSGYSLFYKSGFAAVVHFQLAGYHRPEPYEFFIEPTALVAILIAFLGVGLAYVVYCSKKIPSTRFVASGIGRFGHRMLANRYWMDDFYLLIAEDIFYGISKIIDIFDRYFVDGAVNGIAVVAFSFGRKARKFQTGYLQDYAAAIVGGLCVLMLLLLVWRFV